MNYLFSVMIFGLCISFFADQNTTAFKEVAIIRHPRVGEYAFGFITSSVVLQVTLEVANCLLHHLAFDA